MSSNPSSGSTSFTGQIWIWMLSLSVAMLALLGWSFLHLEPGTPSYVIGQVSAIVLGVIVIGTLIALLSSWRPF